MADPQHRVRTTTEMIDAAFQLLKRNYPALLTISAIGCIPLLLLGLAIGMNAEKFMHGPIPGSPPITPVIALLGVVTCVALTFTMNALIRAVSDAYLGRPIDITGSFRMSAGKIFSLWGAYILSGVIIIVGMILLIIPGIIATLLLFLVPVTVVLEDCDSFEALKRSYALCKGNKGRITGLMTAAFVAGAVVGIIVVILAAVLHAFVIQQLLNTVVNVLTFPLWPTFMVFEYYQARIEKEGYDVELLVQSAPSALTPSIAVE